jgi:probable addiction module antidote protein
MSHPLRRLEANSSGRHREGKEVAGKSKKAVKPVSRRPRSAVASSYDQWARRTLAADTDLAAEYMREVLESSDTPEEFLLGLRRIAEAQGMSKVAEAAGLSRESLYRSLSAAGNPRLSTLVAVLRVAGLKLSVRPAA